MHREALLNDRMRFIHAMTATEPEAWRNGVARESEGFALWRGPARLDDADFALLLTQISAVKMRPTAEWLAIMKPLVDEAQCKVLECLV